MSGDKSVEALPVGTKPSFGARLKAHFKKWWWVHLIVLCVVVLVIALPLVYVGYPNIAQNDINDSTLEVESMVITDPSPEGFHVQQTQVIGSDSVFHPQIYSFDAEVGLEGAAKPFATITVPEVQAKDGVVVHVDQQLTFTDADAFTEFSTAVILREEIGLTVKGNPNLKLGALPTIDVDYDKVVPMKGLNKLAGFKVVEMHLDSDRDDGNNANGTVFIPNPSVMTITMGNVTLDLSSNGTAIGQSFLNNLVLKPGGGQFPMLAKVDNLKLISMMPRNPPYDVPVDITGNSSMYNGKELSYFSKALAANPLKIQLDIGEVVGAN